MPENITLNSEQSLKKAIKEIQNTVQKNVSSIADHIEVPDDLMKAVLSFVDEEQPDTRGWKEVIRIFVATQILVKRMQEQDIISAAEMLTTRIGDAISMEYVWNKIKHLYPEIPDGPDCTVSPMGIDILNKILDAFTDARLKIKIKLEPTEKVTAKRAREAVFDLTKVNNEIFNPANNIEFVSNHGKEPYEREPLLIRTGQKKGRDVITLLDVDWNEDDLKKRGINIPSWHRLTAFDREVYTAVGSLYLAAEENRVLTRAMIFRVLSGNKDNASPTPEMLEAIDRSIERMSVIRVTINATQEVKAGYNVEDTYSDYLLNTTIARRTMYGKTVEAIKINTPPILYIYANAKNQIARMNVKMLDAPVNNTQENIMLKGYLARRLATAKGKKEERWRTIKYDTIYEYLGLRAEDFKSRAEFDNKKKYVRDKGVKPILEYWKKEGEIKAFREERDGKKIAKIILEF